MDINNIFNATIKLNNKTFNNLINQKKIVHAIKNKRSIINKLYMQLGKITYKSKNIKEYNELVQDICNRIRTEKINLKGLKEQLELQIKSTEQTQATQYKKNEVIEQYNVPDVAPEPIKNSDGLSLYKFCPKCMVGNNPDSITCVYCGTKFTK